MSKIEWKAGNMLYPLPVVMVTAADEEGHDNIITVAWTGNVCSGPARAYISVRPERYSYGLIKESGRSATLTGCSVRQESLSSTLPQKNWLLPQTTAASDPEET